MVAARDASAIVVSARSAYQVRQHEYSVVLGERSHLHEVMKEGGIMDSMLSPSVVMMVAARMWTCSLFLHLNYGSSTSHSGRFLEAQRFFAILGLAR